jgi:hypothetical protein
MREGRRHIGVFNHDFIFEIEIFILDRDHDDHCQDPKLYSITFQIQTSKSHNESQITKIQNEISKNQNENVTDHHDRKS